MLQKESFLEVADNSGAQLLQVIHLVGSTRKRFAYTADMVKCVREESYSWWQVKRVIVVTVVIVRTRKEYNDALMGVIFVLVIMQELLLNPLRTLIP